MEILVAVLPVLLVVAVVLLVVRSIGSPEPVVTPEPWETREPGGSVVVLDLVPEDPRHPSVQRIVQEVGRRALLAAPELDHVEVRDRDGRVLDTVTPPPPLPAELSLPAELHEPHTRRSRVPSPVAHAEAARPLPAIDDEPVETVRSPFSEQYDLDPRVRARLTDPDDPIALVRAILEAAGHEPEISGDLVRLDDVAIVLLSDLWHGTDDALARSFLRIQRARVPRGVIIHLGWVNPEALRRREAAAPNVRHVGPEAIQRMADAVAAGADPVTFAVGPAVVR